MIPARADIADRTGLQRVRHKYLLLPIRLAYDLEAGSQVIGGAMAKGTWTRRQFLASGAAAGMLFPGRGVGAASSRSPRYRYVDIHVHLGAFYYGREVTVDGLIRWMDEHFVERACILPLVSPEAAPYVQTNEAAVAAHKAHPNRIIPFCVLDPRSSATAPSTFPPLPHSRPGHVNGLKGMIEILQRYKEAGVRGLGEHKVGLPFDHPLMMTLYEACQQLYLPVLFHLDNIRGIDEPGLPHLRRALKAFPELPFIGHAAGFWASISADATPNDFGSYPRGRPIVPGGALETLMDDCPNLYGDLSEPGGETALTRDPDFAKAFVIRRADRLLFGSDYLQPGQNIPHFEILEKMNLPDDVQRKVYRGNAIRILKLGLD